MPHSEFLSWSDEDRAKAIAYLTIKNERCALCGTAHWEWEENKRAYEPVENFCMGCYLKSLAAEETGNSPGVTIGLSPTRGREAAQRLVQQKRTFERQRQEARDE